MFDINQVEKSQYSQWIAAAVIDAIRWLEALEAANDGVSRQSVSQWAIDKRLSSKYFAFTRHLQYGEVYFHMLSNPNEEHVDPIDHPLSWFAIIPWIVTRQPLSSTVVLSFDMWAITGKKATLSITLSGSSQVLSAFETAKSKNMTIRSMLGDGVRFIMRGWEVEF